MGANALDVPKETGRPVSTASTLSDQATVINDEKQTDEKTADDGLSEKGAGSVTEESGARPGTEDSKAAVTGGADADEDDGNEYPSGFKMFFILLALVLGVFLLALDMVCLFLVAH